ncbi:MAG: stage III sporulation protein AC [Syntrophomonadaceae bacterium]|jgi:stage III sporulation protein AC|nr:stage III sporulation protein AC [Syntrophomonadaceae bacterium]
MSIDLVFKIAIVGIVVSVLHIVLKQAGKEDIAQIVTLAGVIVVLVMVIELISDLFVMVKTVFQL